MPVFDDIWQSVPEDRPLGERCLMSGNAGPPITPGLSATMPIINAVMHTAREVLDAGGVPEPYATIGEYAAAMLVPVPYVGNVPGSAYRPPRAA